MPAASSGVDYHYFGPTRRVIDLPSAILGFIIGFAAAICAIAACAVLPIDDE